MKLVMDVEVDRWLVDEKKYTYILMLLLVLMLYEAW